MKRLLAFLLLVSVADAHQYVFKVKTRGGSTIGNIVFNAKNGAEANVKLQRRYKGCTVLSMSEKK